MAKRKTAEISNYGLLAGDKLYLQRAKKVLPYLVRQAKAGQTIYYSALAKEAGIPNPRNLNYVLGAIGNALIELSQVTKKEIPPIQCLVINKRDEMPGEGFGGFISSVDFSQLNRSQKQIIIKAQLASIFSFPHWDWVLKELGLEALKINLSDIVQRARQYGTGGESEEHKIFKEYICKNPSVLGLDRGLKNGQMEFRLLSADEVDVLFENGNQLIGVEVKSVISDTPDILRGMFQCIKYKSLLEAEQSFNGQYADCRSILALQGSLPKELISVKNVLGIEVFDNISIEL